MDILQIQWIHIYSMILKYNRVNYSGKIFLFLYRFGLDFYLTKIRIINSFLLIND